LENALMPILAHSFKLAVRSTFLIAAFLCVSQQVLHALFPLLDGRVNITSSVSEQYDSNIGSSPDDPISDQILTMQSELVFSREVGLVAVNANVGLEIGRFHQDRRLNYENTRASLNFNYPNGSDSNLQAIITGNFLEASSANPIIGERVGSQTMSLSTKLRYDFLPIYGVGVNFDRNFVSSQIAPSGTQLSDVEQQTLGAQFFYTYSELLEFKATYRRRENLITGIASDSISVLNASNMSGIDETLSVGVDGQFTALLSGGINVGVQRRSLNSGVEEPVSIFSATNFIWTIRPDVTQVNLGINADSTPTPTNDSILGMNYNLSINHTFSTFFSGSGGVSYGTTEFTSTPSLGPGSAFREDKTYGVNLSFIATFNEYLQTGISGNHTWTETNSGSGFNRTSLQVNLNLKF